MASTGNFIDFGDLIQSTNSNGTVNSPTRGVTLGGSSSPSRINNIEYITISTAGNTTDFGDLSTTRARGAAFSDSNGGLTQW